MKRKIKTLLFLFSVSMIGIKPSPLTTNKKINIDEVNKECNKYDFFFKKNELINSVNKYIKSVAPKSELSGEIVVELCLKYDVDLVFVLAQGKIESHFGTKGLANKTNSVWNVGSFDGATYSKVSKKNKYETPNHSTEPYLKLLTSNYLVNKTTNDLLKKFVNKNNKRYATSLLYEKELNYVYNKINKHTDIGKLYQLINKNKKS